MFRQLLRKFSGKTSDKQEAKKQSSPNKDIKQQEIEPILANNVIKMKNLYSIPENSDVKIHQFKMNILNKDAALLFISTITDEKIISENIIEPLTSEEHETASIYDAIHSQTISEATCLKDIITSVNQGNTVLFVDGSETAYVIDTAKFEGRSVEKPENEVILKGPKEAFNESASTNISLIRKKIRNENLVVEMMKVSDLSNNDVYILYLKHLTNEQLIKDVKERVSKIKVDAIQNLSLLEQYIEDKPTSIFPTILNTERPDRASTFLEEGFVVLLMNNSPSSLVLPATLWSFIHNPEDHYLRFVYGNFTRILRFSAVFITIFASAIYVAITNYHAEMVPTDLLLAISATREKVPFPSFFEILMMEIAFELIREAGLRVPNPIGPTIGIVGALILGQAAVQANIVSPIVVIVVALSGLCSYTISDISMNFTVRIIRFAFIFAAGLLGILGMSALFMVGLSYMVTIRSFGVPYLAPMSPKYASSKDTIIRRLLENERIRPGYVKPKDLIKKQRN